MAAAAFRGVLLLQRDVARAVQFYGAAGLGLRVRAATDRHAQLACPAGALHLHLQQTDRCAASARGGWV